MDPDDQAEAELLARIGAGEREAFRTLYGRMARPLFSMAMRILQNECDAEEALQDSFVKVWNGAARYDPRRSRPFTWAATIVRRASIDRLRKRRFFGEDSPEMEPAEASVGEAARSGAQESEARAEVRRRLAAAPDGPRRALELALYSGLSHAQIASELKAPPGHGEDVAAARARGTWEKTTRLT